MLQISAIENWRCPEERTNRPKRAKTENNVKDTGEKGLSVESEENEDRDEEREPPQIQASASGSNQSIDQQQQQQQQTINSRAKCIHGW